MLKITKKGDKYWLFEDSEIGLFSPSKFTINLELNEIVIVYENGLKSKRYNVSDCEIYDLGELTPFTTSNGDLFMQKLEELNCPCFQKNENIFNISGGAWGDITGNLSNQTDLQTALDSKLNKDTTAGVERAYIINADGSQSTKATSEFKDVLAFTNLAAFPATGETGKIYIALDNGLTYRWSGSVYVKLSTGKRKHILTYTTNNFNVANLNNISFIAENAWQVGDTMINSGFTNALDAMKTTNAKLLEAPFDCRLKWLMLSFYSGGTTGNFYLGTGNTDGQKVNASTNINSKQIIADIDLSTTDFSLKKYYFEPTIKPDILKGDGFFMMMKSITQDHQARYRFLCTFEIEEI